ncbi:MAG: hypothetical protein M1570_19360 [Chloroflexi bacterium]|nr:hypothetical protein [Chloroflexota bacterium]
MNSIPNTPVAHRVDESAHEYFRQMVASDPGNVQAWLRLSDTEPDARAALEDIEHAVDLKPDDPAVQAALLHVLSARLKNDPFVEFVAETDQNYIVSLRHSRPIVVPKSRSQPAPYPPIKLSEAERVARWVGLMALGLIPAGIGALVLAFLVIPHAWGVARGPGLERDRRVATVALALASGIALIGAGLFGLLLLHWLG